MITLILKDLVKDSSSNDQGVLLFDHLKNAFLKKQILVLDVDSDLSMSSSFLNSSIGYFLDEYGLENFKATVKFKGSKNQFQRIASYVKKYTSIYSV